MKKGGKALSLEKLVTGGFAVPRFFICDASWSQMSVRETLDDKMPATQYFAVRSSALNEDSDEKSFAGHFYTGIGVPRDAVYSEILKVNESFGDIPGSVIVQEFVPSDKAGVLFTEVNKNTIVINASTGLCQPVVSGEACDEYIFDKKGTLLNKEIPKEKNIKLFIDGKIVSKKSQKESLTESEIRQLIHTAVLIQKFFGSPQDIEWSFEGSKLYILQSRPITRDFGVGEREYFDSANIAESYSGIVLPLTCSFAKMVYEQVYKDLLQKSGVSRKKIERHSRIFENLLGFFYGRMYYNMNNWYRMAEFVPGYRRNKENFELMITSNIKQDVATSIKPSLLFSMFYPLIVGAKVAVFGITSARFKSSVKKHLHWLREHDFDSLTYTECISLFNDINKNLLRRWYITLENDFFVMTYLGILKKMLGEEHLQEMLIFPSKATEQVAALASLSKRMSENGPLWQVVEANNIESFESELANDPVARAELNTYLHTFGGRFANELKLESVGVDEDTTKLFAVLRAYRGYIQRLTSVLPETHLSLTKKIIVNIVLSKFKKYAARREEFRLLRSNTFATARRLFRRMGKLLADRGVLDHPDDVFYLQLNELCGAGAEENKRLLRVVEERKREYASYKSASPPSHFSTINNQLPLNERVVDVNSRAVCARPASPGVVRGTVKVFKEFSMPIKIDFDILVTSHTDPGWTALIALSKGLIIEHGGVLSHASIVARELGIPAVIGAENVLRILHDGDTVEIDGSTGTITIL